ncbi:MAG: hypothetical protein ACXWEY_14470 [Bacteroidia bacterium]
MRAKEYASPITLFTGLLTLSIIFVLLAVFKLTNRHKLQNKDTAERIGNSLNLKDSISGETNGTVTIII